MKHKKVCQLAIIFNFYRKHLKIFVIKKKLFCIAKAQHFLQTKYFYLEYAEEEAAFQSFHESKYATIGKPELYQRVFMRLNTPL